MINFRDFGYKNVKKGLLFRSATLNDLSVDDQNVLIENNIKTIVDLRGLAGKNAKVTDNIAAAIQYFETYHRKLVEERSYFKKLTMDWGRSYYREADIKELYDRWKSDRSSYPGWLVLPREKREYNASVDDFSFPKEKLAELPKPHDILFLGLYKPLHSRPYFSLLGVPKPTNLHNRQSRQFLFVPVQ